MSVAGSAAAFLDRERSNRVTPLLVAVSGGADSTALLVSVLEWAESRHLDVIAAHYDHRLRSRGEHDADRNFIMSVCARLGVALVCGAAKPGEVTAKARRDRSGTEAAARSLRYSFFEVAARAVGADAVCTGHTQDDQVETVLMALERGVDRIAAAGMPRRRTIGRGVDVIRPLLEVSRREVERFLRDRGECWSEDRTNADPRYQRNRVRMDLLPALERELPGVRSAILAFQRACERDRNHAQSVAGSLAWTCRSRDTGEDVTSIPSDEFFAAERDARLVSLFGEARRRGIVRASSRIPVAFFAPLLGGPPGVGTVIEGRGQRIRMERGRLVWESAIVRPREYGYLRGVTVGVPVVLPEGRTITVYRGEKATTVGLPGVIELKEACEPFFVRPHRIGDIIRTEGGRKTVGSILADRHVPQGVRARIPVLCDREGPVAVLLRNYDDGDSVSRQPASRTSSGDLGRQRWIAVIRGESEDV